MTQRQQDDDRTTTGRITERRTGSDNWIGERDGDIADAELGSVIVAWHFEAVK